MGNLFDNSRGTEASGVALCHKIILFILRIVSVWDYRFRLQPDAHMLYKESKPADCSVECIPELCNIQALTDTHRCTFLKDTPVCSLRRDKRKLKRVVPARNLWYGCCVCHPNKGRFSQIHQLLMAHIPQ